MQQVLFIAPFQHTFPPRNGGHLRTAHLAAALSDHFELHYLSLQEGTQASAQTWDAQKTSSMTFHDCPLKETKGKAARIKNALKYRWLTRTYFTDTDTALLALYDCVETLLMHTSFDCIIVTALSPAPFYALSSKHRIPLIFDAHNVDSILLKQRLSQATEDRAQLEKQFKITEEKETSLHRYCARAFACSDIDKEQLEAMNAQALPVFNIPNGVDCSAHPFTPTLLAEPPQILFCGSLNYLPNQEGLLWFYEHVWPSIKEEVPQATLTIIGRTHDLSPYNSLREDSQIQLIGEVDDIHAFYQKSTIAIVPLHLGSGTRLKILEAMSLGIPMVTTSQGVEGIEAEHGVHLQIADAPSDFANAAIHLLTHSATRDTLRENARDLVEKKYDWQLIGKHAKHAIDTIIQ